VGSIAATSGGVTPSDALNTSTRAPGPSMNRLKSVFVVAMTLTTLGALGDALLSIASGAAALPWLGVLLGAGSLLTFFLWLMGAGAARTSQNLPVLVGAASLGLTVALVGFIASEGAPWRPLVWGAVALGDVLLYVFWYSHLPRAGAVIALGETLPAFTLHDPTGAPVTSTALLAGKATLLMFYRGNWCPLCMAQIKEVATQYRALADRGVQVALVSPQPPGHTRSLARRFEVPFVFLVDRDLQAARILGLAHESGLPTGLGALGYDSDTVLPTVILTDHTGRVVWRQTTDNYRVRPEPATFIAAIDEAGLGTGENRGVATHDAARAAGRSV